MSKKGTGKGSVISFNDVSFYYDFEKYLLRDANFNLRRGAKVTLMGQNGAGKSTLFKLITGELEPEEGNIVRQPKLSIAVSRQVIPRNELEWTVREFFEGVFDEKIYDIDKRIKNILEVVNLPWYEEIYEKKMDEFSGGQQARLLLASALIQEPTLLLLDEPTNNLDTAGIEHLTEFLQNYRKTVVVISHDADFLNAFTEGVLYLDIYSRTIEQYVGDYYDVLEQVGARIEKEKRNNARLEKSIQQKKDKANFFANKGGRLRAVAKQMREDAADAEENKVAVRKDDKTIRKFTIPVQADFSGRAMLMTSFTRMVKGKIETRECNIDLRKGERLVLEGPNGIGKTTLLESLANETAPGVQMGNEVKIGYYRQDFSTLDFNDTVYQSLVSAAKGENEERLRAVASGFLLTKEVMSARVGSLSEGQKGLLAFARLVLEEPGLLILDEPTNHINFRHIPIIAKALNEFAGAMIIISHVPDFLEQLTIDHLVNLAK